MYHPDRLDHIPSCERGAASKRGAQAKNVALWLEDHNLPVSTHKTRGPAENLRTFYRATGTNGRNI